MLIVGGLFEYPAADRRPNQTGNQTYDELHFSSNYPCLLCADQLGEFCILDISGQWSLGITLGLHLLFLLRNTQGVTHVATLMGRGESCTDTFLTRLN